MNILLVKWKICLFRNAVKKSSKVFKINSRKQSTVDLAHEVYGQLGSVTPIIIIHGLMGSKKNWRSVAKKIHESAERPVIAVDVRNHGDSPHVNSHKYTDLAADIARLMDQKGLQKAVLIGHSMGGRTAMVSALTQPDKVSGLVVVDISPISSPNVLSDYFPKLIDAMKTINFDVDTVSKAREKAKEALIKSGTIDGGGAMNFLLMNIDKRDGKFAWIVNLDTLKQNFTEIATFPAEMGGKTYQGPTLFVVGSQSHFVPPTDIPGIKAIFPKADVQFLDAGHNVHIEKTEEFVSLIRKFVKESVK